MAADIKATAGACQYTILKEEFWSTAAYTPLRKNSPYTKSISKGYGNMFLKCMDRHN